MYNNIVVCGASVYNMDYGAIAIYYGIVRHRISDFIEKREEKYYINIKIIGIQIFSDIYNYSIYPHSKSHKKWQKRNQVSKLLL